MLEIDGSQGEGGGQVLRTALTLSVITGHSVRLTNIRAHRRNPGLQPQHLNAVHAAATISHAQVTGAAKGAQTLVFVPHQIAAGNYRFDIGTAGSVSLVLQTVLLPLAYASTDSQLVVTGGTHVPWSPPFHYLAWHWQPYLLENGLHLQMAMDRAGFYPPGGGRVRATVSPGTPLRPLTLSRRGRLLRIRGLSGVAGLDRSIAERQRHRACERLQPLTDRADIAVTEVPARSKGTFIILLAEFEHSRCCYSALGERGKPAERVADEAVDAFQAFLGTEAAIDAYLADQLILPLALTPGVSCLHSAVITPHLLTNAEIVQGFLPAKITISGQLGAPGTVVIAGRTPAFDA